MALWLAPSNVFTPFTHSLPLLATLSELDDLLLPQHDPLLHLLLKGRGDGSKRRQRQQWTRSVDLRGFAPSEVSVKREEQKLRVVARHEDGDDVTEVKRTVEVPQDVDVEKLSSGFTRDGVLLLQAPFKEQPETETSEQQQQQQQMSAWEELRGLLRCPDLQANGMEHVVEVEGGGKRFKADLPVREFKPEEIRVRQLGDRVLVEAEHKEESGGQRVHRRLERIFHLPEGTKLDQVVSKLTHDGHLLVEAPFESVPAAELPQLKDVPMVTVEHEKPKTQDSAADVAK